MKYFESIRLSFYAFNLKNLKIDSIIIFWLNKKKDENIVIKYGMSKNCIIKNVCIKMLNLFLTYVFQFNTILRISASSTSDGSLA